MSDSSPTRIAVVGTSCAGKSTMAAALAQHFGLPRVELDAIYWGPDWTPTPPEEFRARVAEALAQPGWVVDGNYGMVRDLIWPRAQRVVWLNFGLATVFRRGLRRTLRRGLTREELWNGNRESLARQLFTRDSLLLWILTTHRRRRRQFEALRASGTYPHLEWVEFRTPRDADEWLAELTNRRSAPGA